MVAVNRHMDFHAMDLVGVREEVLSLAGHFSRLLGIRDKAYHPLTLDFICTLRTKSTIILNNIPTHIMFQVNDEPYALTLD